jgi:putative peptidoglycan lipid II flippase
VRVSISKDAFWISSLTFVSRLLGFARDVLLAYVLGASAGLDAFLVAFKLPNLLRRLYAEGILNQALVPALKREEAQQKDLSSLLAQLLGTLGVIMLIFTIGLWIFSPWVVRLLAPGFVHFPQKWHLATQLLRLSLPYLPLVLLTGVYSAFLNAQSRFTIPAMLPIVLNIVFIGVLWACGDSRQILYMLAGSISVIGLCQLLLSGIATYRVIPWRPMVFAGRERWMKGVLIEFFPIVFSVSVIYVGFFVDMLFASTLSTGSISALYYTERLIMLPMSVIGSVMVTILLPRLTQSEAVSVPLFYEKILSIVIWTLPASLGLYFLSPLIVTSLFYHGAFSEVDVWHTAACVSMFAFSLLPFIAVKIVSMSFFVAGKTRYPFICAVLALFVNILCNFIFIRSLGLVGLALGTVCAGWTNALLLCVPYVKKLGMHRYPYQKIFIQVIAMNIFLGGVLYYLKGNVHVYLGWDVIHRVMGLFVRIAVVIAMYGVFLFMLIVQRKHESKIYSRID